MIASIQSPCETKVNWSTDDNYLDPLLVITFWSSIEFADCVGSTSVQSHLTANSDILSGPLFIYQAISPLFLNPVGLPSFSDRQDSLH